MALNNWGSQPIILIVEDTDDQRSFLVEYLVLEGYRVIDVDNADEAIELIRRRCPDVILMDVMLPGKNGITATKEIRRFRTECGDVPILAMTGHHTVELKQQALKAGCVDYITKPIDMNALRETLKSLIEKRRAKSA
jgi:CheY-like chemotaxis protein